MVNQLFSRAARALAAMAVLTLLAPVAGRCLADQPYAPATARQQIEHQKFIDEQRATTEKRMSDTAAAFDRKAWGAGFDLALTYPLAESGWDPGLGVGVGFGGRGSFGRVDIDLLQWTRKEGGETFNRRFVDLFAGWRIPLTNPEEHGQLNMKGPWLQAGFEMVSDTQDALQTGGTKGSVTYVDWGLVGGAGYTQAMGSFYLAAKGLYHFHKHINTSASAGAAGKAGAGAIEFALLIGYAGSHPITGD